MYMRILIVEDNEKLAGYMKKMLEGEGYAVDCVHEGMAGERMASMEGCDLVLLDVMLPGQDGVTIAKHLREKGNTIPIIMITARGSEMDKVSGLDTGADDYVTKPFSIPELMARIRAVLRRFGNVENNAPERFELGNILLDFKEYRAFRGNEELRLSAKEFDIMKYFIAHENEAVHRHDLLNEVWGFEAMPTTRTVDNFILDLRKKLEKDPSNPQHIISVRGVGYRFIK